MGTGGLGDKRLADRLEEKYMIERLKKAGFVDEYKTIKVRISAYNVLKFLKNLLSGTRERD